MSFELECGEAVGAGVRRVVDEQLEKALEDLRGADPKEADAAVHSARKRFKRVRAVLRLVRTELGEELFARENAAFRDAGGSLGEARDAAVLVETLESLKGCADGAAYAAARKRLMARRRAVRERVLGAGAGLEEVAVAAEAARPRVADWPVRSEGWDALRRGIKRAYREGRAHQRLAEVGGDAEQFHEWRKRVKDLWHQLEVVEGAWPAVIKGLAEECHRLAETLGKEHDLAVLKEVLEAEARAEGCAASPLIDAIEAKREALQRAAIGLGARVYAEKAGAFVERLGAYWEAWAAEACVEPAAADDDAAADEPAGPSADEHVEAEHATSEAGGGGGAEAAGANGSSEAAGAA